MTHATNMTLYARAGWIDPYDVECTIARPETEQHWRVSWLSLADTWLCLADSSCLWGGYFETANRLSLYSNALREAFA